MCNGIVHVRNFTVLCHWSACKKIQIFYSANINHNFSFLFDFLWYYTEKIKKIIQFYIKNLQNNNDNDQKNFSFFFCNIQMRWTILHSGLLMSVDCQILQVWLIVTNKKDHCVWAHADCTPTQVLTESSPLL